MVGPAGSSLTAIAGSTAALKWDPPLMQLGDWLSHYGPSIIIFFFFFSRGRYRPSRDLLDGCASSGSSSPATLHVWELSHFLCSPIRCLLGLHSV